MPSNFSMLLILTLCKSTSVEELKREISLLKQEVSALKSLVESSEYFDRPDCLNTGRTRTSAYIAYGGLVPFERSRQNKQYMLRNDDPMEWGQHYRVDYSRSAYHMLYTVKNKIDISTTPSTSFELVKGQKSNRYDILISPLVYDGQIKRNNYRSNAFVVQLEKLSPRPLDVEKDN